MIEKAGFFFLLWNILTSKLSSLIESVTHDPRAQFKRVSHISKVMKTFFIESTKGKDAVKSSLSIVNWNFLLRKCVCHRKEKQMTHCYYYEKLPATNMLLTCETKVSTDCSLAFHLIFILMTLQKQCDLHFRLQYSSRVGDKIIANYASFVFSSLSFNPPSAVWSYISFILCYFIQTWLLTKSDTGHGAKFLSLKLILIILGIPKKFSVFVN